MWRTGGGMIRGVYWGSVKGELIAAWTWHDTARWTVHVLNAAETSYTSSTIRGRGRIQAQDRTSNGGQALRSIGSIFPDWIFQWQFYLTEKNAKCEAALSGQQINKPVLFNSLVLSTEHVLSKDFALSSLSTEERKNKKQWTSQRKVGLCNWVTKRTSQFRIVQASSCQLLLPEKCHGDNQG